MDRKTWGIFAGLYFLAITLRAVYYFQVHTQLLFQALILDAQYYDAWARQLMSQGWQGKGIFFVSPLYAYVLAAVYSLGGSPVIVKFIQFAVGATLPLFIYALTRRLFNSRIALLAGIIACFYGPQIFFEGLLLKASLEVFLVVVFLYSLVKASQVKKTSWWFFSGVILGLSVLAKDTGLLLIPVFAVWVLWHFRPLVRSLKPALVFFLSAAAVVGVLTVRNAIVGHDLVLTTYGAGMNFHMGNFIGSDGALKEPDFIRIDPLYEESDSSREAVRRSGRPLKPSEISSFWITQTLRDIRHDPANFRDLILRKAGLLFNRTGLSDNYQMEFFKQYSPLFKFGMLGFWFVSVFGVCGIALSFWRKENAKYSPLLIYFFTAALLLILGHIIDRYREVLVPVLIPFSAFFLVQYAQYLWKKNYSRIIVCTGAMVACVMFTTMDFPNFKQAPYADAHNQLGLLYHERGDYSLAEKEYLAALTERTDHLWARQNLADVYLRQGRVDDAVSQLRQAILHRPDVLELYVLFQRARELRGSSRQEVLKALASKELLKKVLGASIEHERSPSFAIAMELMAQKKYQQASQLLEKYLVANPGSVNALINLGVAYRGMGSPEKAIDAYWRALKAFPEMIPAKYNLSMIYLSQKRFAQAIPFLEEVVAVLPEYGMAQVYLGNSYKETGNNKEAIRVYRAVVARLTDSPSDRAVSEQLKDKIWFLERALNLPPAQGVKDQILEKRNFE